MHHNTQIVMKPEGASNIVLPRIPLTPRQEGTVAFPSPRKLGDPVADPRSTSVQRRLRLLESKAVTSQHVNPIAAWPSSSHSKVSNCLTTRPPLSVELENFVRKEHRQLLLTTPNATQLEQLPVYREAFGCLINHFPEYASLFAIIKSGYDTCIAEISAVAQRCAQIDLENKSMKGTHLMQLTQEREQMQTCLSESQAQLAASLRTNQAQRQQIANLEFERGELLQRFDDRSKEFDDANERVRVLGATLVEEASRMSKLMASFHKAQQEIVRLNHLIDSLRQIVAESERTIQVFRLAPAGDVVSADAPPTKTHGQSFRSKSIAAIPKTIQPNASPVANFCPIPLPSGQRASLRLDTPRLGGGRLASPQSGRSKSLTPDVSGMGPGNGNGFTNEEVEALRDKIFDLECHVETREHQLSQLQKEYNTLHDQLSRIQQQHGRDTMTPRPDWREISSRLPGFQVPQRASSSEIATELVTHLRTISGAARLANERKALGEIIWNWLKDDDVCETDLLHRYKYFPPRGTSKTVPVYLRTAKPTRNRRLKKSDAEMIITRFWTARFLQRRTIPFPTVDESWLDWATKQCGSQAAAVELSYNIVDVCERNSMDPDCKLFLKIMRGDLCEMIVSDQRQAMEGLLQTCHELREPGDRVLISKHNFFKAVRIVFPGKSSDHTDKLRFTLAITKPEEYFDYRDIFTEDGDKSQSQLAELLRKQHIEEIEFFTVEVVEALRALVVDDMLCIADGMNVILQLDPGATETDVQQTFSIACRLTLPDLLGANRSMKMEAEPILQRIKLNVLLKRAAPVPSSNAEKDDD